MPRISYVSNEKFRRGESGDPLNENYDLCLECWHARHSFIPIQEPLPQGEGIVPKH